MTEKTQEAQGSGIGAIASGHVGNGIKQADQQLQQLTGRSGAAWMKVGEKFARTHPIKSALIVLGAMYVVKKFR